MTLATSTLNEVVALTPEVSVAVMAMTRVPTSALAGVPEKVWVAASKLSQEGKAPLSAKVAL